VAVRAPRTAWRGMSTSGRPEVMRLGSWSQIFSSGRSASSLVRRRVPPRRCPCVRARSGSRAFRPPFSTAPERLAARQSGCHTRGGRPGSNWRGQRGKLSSPCWSTCREYTALSSRGDLQPASGGSVGAWRLGAIAWADRPAGAGSISRRASRQRPLTASSAPRLRGAVQSSPVSEITTVSPPRRSGCPTGALRDGHSEKAEGGLVRTVCGQLANLEPGRSSSEGRNPKSGASCGAPSGTRTPNPLIKSQLLCQLS
jgi:hypothetical protein